MPRMPDQQDRQTSPLPCHSHACRDRGLHPHPCRFSRPPPPSNGYTHLFTIIDRYSRWPKAVPLKSTTAQDCTNALMLHWVSRFVIPHHLTSDRGPHFTSALWTSLATILGVSLHHTSAYHPQPNGVVERFHHGLKVSLRACLSSPSWIKQLPWVLLGLWSSVRRDFGCLSVDLLLRSSPLLPGELFCCPQPAPPSTTPTIHN